MNLLNRYDRLSSGFMKTGLLPFVLIASLLPVPGIAYATEDEPLNFAFTQTLQGEHVQLDGFRLRADCHGAGPVTILLEPGLGGSAFEWEPVKNALTDQLRVCVYDRAGYAWSDPSPFPRHARQLASEADQLLSKLSIDGPLIIVAHSFGGFIARMLADLRSSSMVGLVLLDSSHEDQLDTLEKLDGKNRMPRDNSFVVSQVDIPDALPRDVQRKIAAFSRMRKTYVALHSEMTHFRRSADQVRQTRKRFEFPVVVVRRGRDLYGEQNQGESKTAIWQALQEDMLGLSVSGRMVVAQQSGHHIHAEQPQLVVEVIHQLLDEYQDQSAEQQ